MSWQLWHTCTGWVLCLSHIMTIPCLAVPAYIVTPLSDSTEFIVYDVPAQAEFCVCPTSWLFHVLLFQHTLSHPRLTPHSLLFMTYLYRLSFAFVPHPDHSMPCCSGVHCHTPIPLHRVYCLWRTCTGWVLCLSDSTQFIVYDVPVQAEFCVCLTPHSLLFMTYLYRLSFVFVWLHTVYCLWRTCTGWVLRLSHILTIPCLAVPAYIVTPPSDSTQFTAVSKGSSHFPTL